MPHTSNYAAMLFLSTPSARRATQFLHGAILYALISIHALREEGDDTFVSYNRAKGDFYPRPPRGGRPKGRAKVVRGAGISIHALREEGDVLRRGVGGDVLVISIHALREEGDENKRKNNDNYNKFLSTPSARRATDLADDMRVSMLFLSTPSARRATRQGCEQSCGAGISIHALREEGDAQTKLDIAKQAQFLSTPSARRATR